MNTAQDEWMKFAEEIGLTKPDVPDTQRTEMRRAFYAGQLAMFAFQILEMAPLPTAQAERVLTARRTELYDFFRANFQKRQ